MTLVASTTLAETRSALQRHWAQFLSVTFIALIPLWIGLFIADILGLIVLPFIGVALYVHIRQSVDPEEQTESLLTVARRYVSTAVAVLALRLVVLVLIAQLFVLVFGQVGTPIPGFNIGNSAVPVFDVNVDWSLIVGLVAALPFSALPVMFTGIVSASEGIGPSDALKQNYRLWRNAPAEIFLYAMVRFALISSLTLLILLVWLTFESLTVAAVLTMLTAPALFMVLSVYHFYYYTDLIMRA